MPDKKVVPEMVSVPKDELKSILEDVKKLKESNAMLLETADKNRVAHFMAKNQDFSTNKCRVTTYEGKIVTSWKSVRDIVGKRANGWMEDQQVEITVQDLEKPVIISLVDFGNLKKIEAEIVADTEQKTLNGTIRILTLKVGENNFPLDVIYVN